MSDKGPSNNGKKKRRPVPKHLPGHIADRYRILSLLGRGAAGEVVEAYDLFEDRLVAIKILKRECARNPDILDRFLREATAMGRIDHPGIVHIYETGVDKSGLHFLVMEIIHGDPLSEVLKARGRLPANEVARIAAEICEVMQVAHHMKIYHRDLKPSNLLVPDGWLETGQNHIRVVDFGTAKIATPTPNQYARKLTTRGDMIGTPQYMSPEQASGRPVDGRSDLYSLGCVMYQCLCGHIPFDGPNHFSVIVGHLERNPVRIDQLVGVEEVPTVLADFIHTLLAKAPRDRHVNAAAADAELRQMMGFLPLTISDRVIPTPAEFRAQQPIPGLPRTPPKAPEPPSFDFEIDDDEVTSALSGPSSQAESVPAPPQPPPPMPPPKVAQAPPPTPPQAPPPVPEPPPIVISAPEPAPIPELDPLDTMPTTIPLPQNELPTEMLVDVEEPTNFRGPLLGLVGLLAIVAIGIGAGVAIYVGYTAFFSTPTPSVPPEVVKKEVPDPVVEDPDEGEPDTGESPEPVSLRNIGIYSEPDGAEVLRGDKRLGVTPLSVGLEDDEPLPAVFLIKKAGHEVAYVIVREEDLSTEGHRVDLKLKTLKRGSMAKLEILTEPSGAEVQEDGRYIGLTPVHLARPTSQQVIRLGILYDGGKRRDLVLGLTNEELIFRVPADERADPVPEVREPFKRPKRK